MSHHTLHFATGKHKQCKQWLKCKIRGGTFRSGPLSVLLCLSPSIVAIWGVGTLWRIAFPCILFHWPASCH